MISWPHRSWAYPRNTCLKFLRFYLTWLHQANLINKLGYLSFTSIWRTHPYYRGESSCLGRKTRDQTEIHSTWQASAKRLRWTLQPNSSLWLAGSTFIWWLGTNTGTRNRLDVDLQSRKAEYGHRWNHTQNEVGHGGLSSTFEPC